MMAIILERIGFNNIRVRMGIFHRSLVNGHPFFNKKFKDFSGLSETPFRAKKSLDSMSFLVLPQHSNFILKVFLCLLLLCNWESGLDKVSTDGNFQRLSRNFKVHVNPTDHDTRIWFNGWAASRQSLQAAPPSSFLYRPTPLGACLQDTVYLQSDSCFIGCNCRALRRHWCIIWVGSWKIYKIK